MPEIPIGADVVEAAIKGFDEAVAGSGAPHGRGRRVRMEAAIREALDKLGLREEFGLAREGYDTPHTTCPEREPLEPCEHGDNLVRRLTTDWRQVDAEPAVRQAPNPLNSARAVAHRRALQEARRTGQNLRPSSGDRVDSEPRERPSRNEVTDAWFKGTGGRTFCAPPPLDYEGRVVCLEAIRVADHAHIEVSTGRQHANGPGRDPTYHKGVAGRLVFAWGDWVHLRDALDAIPWVWLAEVEEPTPAQVDRYAGPNAISEPYERITHGRHCLCSACAAQDWAEPGLAPCGMHGPSCPPVYAPLGAAGDVVRRPSATSEGER